MTSADRAAVGLRSLLPTPRSQRGRWLASFALLLLLASAWALASPMASVPDEGSHVVKAAAVARGQLLGRRVRDEQGTRTFVRVPAFFARVHDLPGCYTFKPEVTADCAPAFTGTTEEREVLTWAGNYPPLYYLLVGLPSLAFPSARGVYLMRLLSAAVCAAFLSSALASAVEWRRSRFLVLGVALAVTPMVLFLTGGVNPNSLEIAAAVCLWASGLVLVGGGDDGEEGRLLARVGLSASTLVLMRGLSPLWLAVVAVVLVGAGSRRALGRLLARRDARMWLALVLASSALAVAWILLVGTLELIRTDAFRELPLSQAVRYSVGKMDTEIRQMVGLFGYLDTPSPALTYYLWFLAVGFVLVLGLAVSSRRLALAVLGVLAATLFLPVAMESARVKEFGFPWQGRYTLPVAVGLPILAAFSVGCRPHVLAGEPRRAAAVLGATLGAAHVAAFAWALRRYSVGLSGTLLFFDGRWQPPVPAAVLLTGFSLVVVAWGWWLSTLAATEAPAMGVRPGERDDLALRLDEVVGERR